MPEYLADDGELLAGGEHQGRAWAELHDAVARLPGWAVGPCQLHGEADRWHVTAVDLAPRGRQATRETIEATGPTEVAALVALAELPEERAATPRAG